MGCLSGLTKYILFLFNFIIVVCGIILIVFGVINLINNNKGIGDYTDVSVGGFAIAVGVFTFLVAFFGCYGAIKENSCMLTTYAAILLTIFIIQLVLGILAFVAIKNDDNVFDKDIKKLVQKLFNDYQDKDAKKSIDNLQEELECCGVVDYKFWTEEVQQPIPNSCCKTSPCTVFNVYKQGCAAEFTSLVKDNIGIIGGIAIGFSVVELIGAIFAFIVRNRH